MTRARDRDWTPELLLAYADGALAPDRARDVEAVIAADPEAAECLARLKAGAVAASGAYARVADTAPPASLTRAADALAVGLAEHARRRQHRRVGLSGWMDRLGAGPTVAVAASLLIMLAVGFGAGRWTAPSPGTVGLAGGSGSEMPVAAADALWRALETDGAEDTVAWTAGSGDTGGTVTVLAPIDTPLSAPCRPFRLQRTVGATTITADGLACRDDAGGWSILTLPPSPTGMADGGGQ